MIRDRQGEAGVTLVEVLVSLAIFAVIGVAGLTVLDTVARTGDRIEGRLERLAEIDRAFLILKRDLAQVADGETRLSEDGLSFRRMTGAGPVRIQYRQEGVTLVRAVQSHGGAPVEQALLPDVTQSRWRALDADGRWRDTLVPEGADPVRAAAAELTLQIMRDADRPAQTVTRVFVLPAGRSE